MGRATALTPAVADRIVSAVEVGVSWKDSAAAAGINEATLHRWRERGREGRAPYRAFCERLDAAAARSVVAMQITVRQAASNGDWKAAAWFLERRRPDDYAPRSKTQVEVSGPQGAPIEVEVHSPSVEEITDALDALIAGG